MLFALTSTFKVDAGSLMVGISEDDTDRLKGVVHSPTDLRTSEHASLDLG